MTLHRLVYYSSNRIVGPNEQLRSEIDQILSTSRKNNDLVGVTGALLFSSGFFGQVLEGDTAAIETTFERIQQDPRHSDVVLLDFKPIMARSFGSWAMAYVGSYEDALDGWSAGSFDHSGLKAEELFSRLHSLVSKVSDAA